MAAGAGLPPGLGVEQATQSTLSASLLTSHTEHIQVPTFGLNKSINEGCAVFSSGFDSCSADLPLKLPKVGLDDESALFVEAAEPKAKLGLAGSAFSPKPKPVAGFSLEDFSPKRKLGLAGSFEVVDLPNAKPVNPEKIVQLLI